MNIIKNKVRFRKETETPIHIFKQSSPKLFGSEVFMVKSAIKYYDLENSNLPIKNRKSIYELKNLYRDIFDVYNVKKSMGFEYDHIPANQYLTFMENSRDPRKRELYKSLNERLNQIISDYNQPNPMVSMNKKLKKGKGTSLNNMSIKRMVKYQQFKGSVKPSSPGRSVAPSRRRKATHDTEQ